MFAHLDAVAVLSRELANEGLYPAIDPLPILVQVAELWALKAGLLDGLPLAGVEDRLLARLINAAHLAGRLSTAHGIDDQLAVELARWVRAASA